MEIFFFAGMFVSFYVILWSVLFGCIVGVGVIIVTRLGISAVRSTRDAGAFLLLWYVRV